ncbi:MAG: PAS domain S-box protein [Nitrospiraceae bacterium]|nr:PAS domain S-box protein [Nitrospiraceae bacterium]
MKDWAYLLDVTHNAIIIRGMDDRITFWNRAARERYGWDQEEASGRVTHELLRTQFPVPLEEIRAELFRGGRWEGELVHRTRDGSRIIVASRWVLRRDDSGGPQEILEINNDITKQKEAEERYQSLFRNSRDAILLTSPADGSILAANQAASELFQMTESEICRAGREGLVDASDPRLGALLEERSRTGSAKGEVTLVRKDGTRLQAEISSSVYTDRGGELRTSTIIRDITDCKLDENALRESEEKFRNVFDRANDGVLIADISTKKFVEANRTICLMTGYDRDEILRLGIEDIHPAEDLPHVAAEFGKQMAGEKTIAEGLRVVRKDGSIFCADVSSSAVTFRGKAYGVGFFRDITKRKQAEEALRESEKRLAQAQRIAHLGHWDRDIAAGTATWSAETFRIFGHEPQDDRVSNEFFLRHLHPEDREAVGRGISDALERSGTFEMEFRIVRPDGTIRYVFAYAEVSRDSGGRPSHFFGTVQDVTERRQVEEQLATARKLESVGILAGGIAHDFNNLLSAILGNVSLAKMAGPLSGGMEKLLREAEEACLRAAELSGRLLTFSSGGEPLREATDIRELLSDAAALALGNSNVIAAFSLPEDMPPVMIDRGQMTQVFRNIVTNAREAMPGGGTVRIESDLVRIDEGGSVALRPGEYVKITVTDHGSGISPDSVGRIFDPYFSTKGMGSRKGQGLGLTICHSIVGKHDGGITVESRPGEGASFAVYLPAGERRSQERQMAPRRPAGPAGQITRVLVMDDEELVRAIVQDILRHYGYDVLAAPDSRQAVEAFRTARASGRPFDVVILDLTIQGGPGGLDTLKELRKVDPSVKAVISSGYADDPAMRHYQKCGFLAAIAKPYTASALKRVLTGLSSG